MLQGCIIKDGLLTHAVEAYYCHCIIEGGLLTCCGCIIESELLTHAMETHYWTALQRMTY